MSERLRGLFLEKAEGGVEPVAPPFCSESEGKEKIKSHSSGKEDEVESYILKPLPNKSLFFMV